MRRRYHAYEPFVLVHQCIQVYYTSYLGASRNRSDWKAVCKTKPRHRIEEIWIKKKVDDEPLQEDLHEVRDEQFAGATIDLFAGTTIDQLQMNLSIPSGSDENNELENDDDEEEGIEGEYENDGNLSIPSGSDKDDEHE